MAPKEYSDFDYQRFLMHHGAKGQTWGVRNGPPYPLNYTGAKNVQELSEFMKGIKYSEFTRLKSPKEVIESKSGSCHDQTYLVLHELKRLGKIPVGLFMIECDAETGQGGMTHSFAFYKDNDGISWFEPSNTWSERAGVNTYKNMKDMRKAIMQAHKSGEYGNADAYPEMVFGTFNFDDLIPGMDLQQLVDVCLSDE